MRIHSASALVFLAASLACGGERQGEASTLDTSSRDLTLAPAESLPPTGDVPEATPRSRPAAPRPRPTVSLATGTEFPLTLRDSISSRRNHAGESFVATAPADVKNASGETVVPAGAAVRGTIVEIKPAPNPNEQGTLTLRVDSVTVNGRTYALRADIVAAGVQRQGRGIEGSDVARTGAGAAAGAIVGRLITKNNRGTVIGGIVGAAAGAATSAAVKDADVVLPAGATLIIRLTEALVVRRG